jgi:hypothetical protein
MLVEPRVLDAIVNIFHCNLGIVFPFLVVVHVQDIDDAQPCFGVCFWARIAKLDKRGLDNSRCDGRVDLDSKAPSKRGYTL